MPTALIGHRGGSGLADNATMFQQAFQALGIAHRRYDSQRLQLLHEHQPAEAFKPGRHITLYALNADDLPAARARYQALQPPGPVRPTIGFFLWECTRAPRLHRLVRPLLDEVWVPTEFVRQVYRELFDDAIDVVNVGKCITLPSWLQAPAQRVADGQRPFVFLNISDFDSAITRKNPLPVVQAFRRAFPGDQGVRLVLKIRRIDPGHWSNAGNYWQQVVAAIAGDERISIVSGDLPQRDYWQLLQSADCYVTLHRAEGFCYGAAQAMLLGVPVIATDFSGTQDYCTAETAWLVAAELTPVRPGEMRFHEALGHWALPDVEQATRHMQAVRQGGSLVAARTAAARQRVSVGYGAAAFQATLNRLLARG